MKKTVSIILALLMVLCIIPAASAASVTITGTHDITIYRVENNVTDYSTILASKKKADMPATLSIVKSYKELGMSQGGKFEGEVALAEVHVTMNDNFDVEDAEVTVNGNKATLVDKNKVVFYATLPERGGITSYNIKAQKPHTAGDSESGKITEEFRLYVDYTNTQKSDKTLNIANVEVPAGADYDAYMVAGKLYVDFAGTATNSDIIFTFTNENKSKFDQIAYATAISGSATGEQKLSKSKATFVVDGSKLKFQVETSSNKYISVEIPVVFRSNVAPADPKGVYFTERSMTIKIGQTVTPPVKALNNVSFNYTLDYADSSSSSVGVDGKTVTGIKAGVAYVSLKCTVNGNTYTDTMKIIVSEDEYVTPSTAYVTATALNVRKGAGTSYGRIGTLHNGDKVTVLSVNNGWAKISYNGGVGYVSAKYLTGTTATEGDYIVVCRALNVRKGAGTSFAKTGMLYRGNKVDVVSINNGWAKINYNGKIAYIAANYLSK